MKKKRTQKKKVGQPKKTKKSKKTNSKRAKGRSGFGKLKEVKMVDLTLGSQSALMEFDVYAAYGTGGCSPVHDGIPRAGGGTMFLPCR